LEKAKPTSNTQSPNNREENTGNRKEITGGFGARNGTWRTPKARHFE